MATKTKKTPKLTREQILSIAGGMAKCGHLRNGRDAAFFLCGALEAIGFDTPNADELRARIGERYADAGALERTLGSLEAPSAEPDEWGRR